MTKPTKHILAAALIAAGVFFAWEMFKAWRAGVSAIGSLFAAPFTAAKAAWDALASFLSQPATIKPGSVGATNQTPSELLGVDPNSALGQMLNSESGSINSQLLTGGSPSQSTSPDQVVGIWGTGSQ